MINTVPQTSLIFGYHALPLRPEKQKTGHMPPGGTKITELFARYAQRL